MSEYKIDLVMKNGPAVIGEADDEVTALDLMEKRCGDNCGCWQPLRNVTIVPSSGHQI